jgi:alcohol dehydrogenase class IV
MIPSLAQSPACAAFDFRAGQRIVFGWGRRAEIGPLARELGRRAFIVHGSRTLESRGALEEIANALRSADVEAVPLAAATREPLVADVDEAVALARQNASGGELVVAVGGGAAIDLAKAVAAVAAQPAAASIREYLEGIGTGRRLEAPPWPVLAVPTTGGTGAEATFNAVISCLDPPCKKSLRASTMLPRVALVDPELCTSSPVSVTTWSGADAATQLIESFVSRRATPLAQALALDGLPRALAALPDVVRDPANRAGREAMSYAALLSGMALANSGLGLAHAVAAALGVVAGVAHGLACAVMLPLALRWNRPVCEVPLARLAGAVGIGAATSAAAADLFVDKIEAWCSSLAIPTRLRELPLVREQLPLVVRHSRGNSMNGNPRDVSDDELLRLLEARW